MFQLNQVRIGIRRSTEVARDGHRFVKLETEHQELEEHFEADVDDCICTSAEVGVSADVGVFAGQTPRKSSERCCIGSIHHRILTA